MEALRHAIATHLDTHKLEGRRLVPTAALLSWCCGLITVEEENKFVRLVHYTTKGILQEVVDDSLSHPHSLLAAVCKTDIAECGFYETTISTTEELNSVLQADPLFAYAFYGWVTHAWEV